MTVYQSVNEFYCGKDLVQPTAEQFLDVLAKKIGISPAGIKVTNYDPATSLDVIASLRVIADSDEKAKQKVDAILKWFWDDSAHMTADWNGTGKRTARPNSMLKFHKVG